MLNNSLKLGPFVLILSFSNFLLFHLPFFKFVFESLNHTSLSGIIIIISLIILMLVLNAFVFYLLFILSQALARVLLFLFFCLNSIALYFIKSYNVIIDETMIGNLLNTNYEESSAFFSLGLILYLFFLGILPGVFIINIKLIKGSLKKQLTSLFLGLVFILSLVYFNSGNWLWIDKNSTKLGALVMPWSYVVNTSRFYIHENKKNKKEILLPNAKIKNTEKSIFVLVIGESARSQNFSLYGYEKPTNPRLSSIKNIYPFKAQSCATYTTAGIKCILEHTHTSKLYEILPNYLYRNNVGVVWRTTNWGEPPVHSKPFLKRRDLEQSCLGDGCNYDEILLSGLKEQILSSSKEKQLIILHTSTSHGPTYNKKYPARFERFSPVCNSVELGKCTTEELVNAYDNTIVYTDYILSCLINDLNQMEEYHRAVLYVSDHGESLGENNLYLHGIPASIAPKEQLDIPFIVWRSEGSKQIKPYNMLSQNHVFHSVLDFLDIESPIYDENMSIFK